MKNFLENNNLIFILRASWRLKKSLFIFYALNIIFAIAFALAAIIAPRELISALINDEGYRRIIYIALIFLAVSGGAGFFMSFIKSYYVPILVELRMIHLHYLYAKILRLDYSIYEDEEALNKIWLVRSLVNDFRNGIQGVLLRLFLISANIVVVSFYFGLIAQLSLWVVLFLAVNMIIVFVFSFYAYRFRSDVHRESSLRSSILE